MDLSKLTYSKGDSGKTPLKPVPKTAIESNGGIGEKKRSMETNDEKVEF